MTCNIGKMDRLLRIIVGLLIVFAGIFYHSWLGVVGVVPLITALVRFCPAYTVLGISTKK